MNGEFQSQSIQPVEGGGGAVRVWLIQPVGGGGGGVLSVFG